MITLKDFDHFRNDPRVRFMDCTISGRSLTTICYMIADSDFWKLPLSLECRGIVFDTETGQCVCRPLEKFFNIGEREDTLVEKLDFDDCLIFEKRDGSMITPVIIEDALHWKSKKSFVSDVALKASDLTTTNIHSFCFYMNDIGYTPIFEFTHPEHQIVIDYEGKQTFTLLAARHTDTGAYLQYAYLRKMASMYGIDIIPEYTNIQCSNIEREPLTVQRMFEQMETLTDFEGYVVQLNNGIRVKNKTKWYLIQHAIMTQMRERDVARSVIEETIDDTKSHLTREGKDLTPVLEIERRVVDSIDSLRRSTEALFADIKECQTRKDAALLYRSHPYFGLAMKMYDGKEPNYKDYWINNFLSSYSLRTIYNTTFDKSDS